MAALDDFLKAIPFRLIGLGMLGIALPIVFPALRPQFAALLKAGAKLALEAEFEADDALADRLADTAVNALLRVTLGGSEKELDHKAETAVNRFLANARSDAHRRGRDQRDVSRRYRKRIAKFDHAVSRAHHRARASQRRALEHASKVLSKHREPISR